MKNACLFTVKWKWISKVYHSINKCLHHSIFPFLYNSLSWGNPHTFLSDPYPFRCQHDWCTPLHDFYNQHYNALLPKQLQFHYNLFLLIVVLHDSWKPWKGIAIISVFGIHQVANLYSLWSVMPCSFAATSAIASSGVSINIFPFLHYYLVRVNPQTF